MPSLDQRPRGSASRPRYATTGLFATLAGLALAVWALIVVLRPSPSSPPDVARLIERTAPAVVTIVGEDGGLGSGFLVGADGRILTAAHLTASGRRLGVQLADGRRLSARTLAVDHGADLALLAVDAQSPLPFLRLADSGRPLLGRWVLVLGNPFGLGPSASLGIVGAEPAALGTHGGGLLQTDAAINPGNSGGPLLDRAGRVVGLASARATGGGIGFAVPLESLRHFLAGSVVPGEE